MKGFTLLEVIIAIFIFILAMAGIFEATFYLYRANSYVIQQSSAIGQARKGIETMVKEIREARNGDDGSYIIEEAQDFEFIFYSDINGDGKTERVRYFLDGTDLKKGVIEPEGWPVRYPQNKEVITTISSYVRNQPPIFRYYDGNGNELPAPSRLTDTKTMEVNLVINVDPNRTPQDFNLRSKVNIRNLKTNL